jgi:predicted ribosomally synthesized peptide with SipW-like signal peptide
MSSNVVRSRWRLILVLIAVFCVVSAGGAYTYAVLSDTETVEVTINGTSASLSTPAPLYPQVGLLADELREDTNEIRGKSPGG